MAPPPYTPAFVRVPGRSCDLTSTTSGRRPGDGLLWLVMAAVAYIPLLATKPGLVAADTKQYLYLDPGRLTAGAASMWDPGTGMGTVTHQNIGYLFPMGPYYTAVHWLGIPIWIGQRIWMGSLVLAAGMGVAYCCRRLGVEGAGRVVATMTYALSPYIVDYIARTSAIVMPWAALGWMVGLTVRAAQKGGWRYPACFALAVALVGGVNATSILLVGLAPLAWLFYAVWGSREVTLRRAAAVAGRIGLLSAGVSVWWAAGLWAEGRYGINVLRVTETVPTVARTSSAAEVLRGLGYWYFYGQDKVQPWTLASVEYTQSWWLLAVSFGLPAVAVAAGVLVRWRYRAFCVLLVLIGVVVAVGTFPYAHPSLVGQLLKGASAGSTAALAMRSSDRIVPIVVLGLALLLGAGVSAIRVRWPALGTVGALACLALVAADLPPLWSGNLVASNLARGKIPAYWYQAASYLDAQGSATRVLGIPGEDFGAYSWGVTQDPIPQGLLTRPYVSRQVVPQGTPASANLLEAFDEQIQEGTFNYAALAPLASLMSAGQILLQNDLQYERYHLPLPQTLWDDLSPAPNGLSAPVAFGAPNLAPLIKYPLNSEERLGLPTPTPDPPALAVYSVANARPIVRTESASSPIVLAGDGSGIVDAAENGLLNGNPTILYSASYANNPKALQQVLAGGARLVVTDTNTLAGQRWGSLRDNFGAVQQPGIAPLVSDPSDYPLPVFPGAGTDTQTVAEVTGVGSVRATQYGDPLSYTPEDQPINAFDNNLSTVWSYGAHAPAAGVRIEADLDAPVTTNHLTLAQLQNPKANRYITEVTLSFDGGHSQIFKLGPDSLSAKGQTITFPTQTFTTLDLTVDAATGGTDKKYDGLSPVGFASIDIPGVGPATESLRLPTDLLSAAGAASINDPLTLLMTRSQVTQPPRTDPEPQMSRTFDLPTARTFTIGGGAEASAADSDYLLNLMIGTTKNGPVPGTASVPASAARPAEVLAANSSTRLDEDRYDRANAAVDGSPNTAWVAETGPQAGEWIDYDLSESVTIDHLSLQVINDGRHSLPTRITISTETGSRTVSVPSIPVGIGRAQGATTTVPLSFPALNGSHVKVTIDAVAQVRSLDYYQSFTGATDILPVGIAELGLPDVVQPATPSAIPTTCQPLLSVDGKPVDVQISGTTAAALAGQELHLSPCGNSSGGITLGPGTHTVTTSAHLPSGWAIDQLSLSSPAGGSAPTATATTTPSSSPPAVAVDSQGRTSMTLTVHGNGQPFWLILGESQSDGWTATTSSGHSLGPSQLIDGYANGWYVPAGAIAATTVIHVQWTPQNVIWAAIGISAASLMVVLGLMFVPFILPETSGLWRRRRRRQGGTPPPRQPELAARGPLAPVVVGRGVAAPLAESRVTPARAVCTALAWGALIASVSRPAIGLLAGVATLAACAHPRARTVVRSILRVGAVGLLASLGLYVLLQQHWRHYWPTIDWPASMSAGNDLAWTGLALLGTDVVVGATWVVATSRLRWRRWGRSAKGD